MSCCGASTRSALSQARLSSGADDVELGVQAGAGVDDPEAHGLPRLRGQRMHLVLARVAVPGHPVGSHLLGLHEVERGGAVHAGLVQVPLAGDEDVVRRRRAAGSRGSTTIAKYIPFAMCTNAGAVPQWHHEDAGVVRAKRERLRRARRDVAERGVRRDARGVEIDRVRHRRRVLQRHVHELPLAHVHDRRRSDRR